MNVVRAEGLFESARLAGQGDARAEIERLLAAPGSPPAPDEFAAYEKYVRLIARPGDLDVSDSGAVALMALAKTIGGEPTPAGFAGEYRRTMLANLLGDAADRIRQQAAHGSSAVRRVVSPYGKDKQAAEQKAKLVHDLLESIGRWCRPMRIRHCPTPRCRSLGWPSSR